VCRTASKDKALAAQLGTVAAVCKTDIARAKKAGYLPKPTNASIPSARWYAAAYVAHNLQSTWADSATDTEPESLALHYWAEARFGTPPLADELGKDHVTLDQPLGAFGGTDKQERDRYEMNDWYTKLMDAEGAPFMATHQVHHALPRYGGGGAGTLVERKTPSVPIRDVSTWLARQPVVSATAEAFYQNTQDLLTQGGFDTIQLYRGMRMTPKQARAANVNGPVTGKGSIRKVRLNPLSSFSTVIHEAKPFAGDHFLSADVPRERIFSTTLSGPGCLGEREVIVIAGQTPDRMHLYREKDIDYYADDPEVVNAPETIKSGPLEGEDPGYIGKAYLKVMGIKKKGATDPQFEKEAILAGKKLGTKTAAGHELNAHEAEALRNLGIYYESKAAKESADAAFKAKWEAANPGVMGFDPNLNTMPSTADIALVLSTPNPELGNLLWASLNAANHTHAAMGTAHKVQMAKEFKHWIQNTNQLNPTESHALKLLKEQGGPIHPLDTGQTTLSEAPPNIFYNGTTTQYPSFSDLTAYNANYIGNLLFGAEKEQGLAPAGADLSHKAATSKGVAFAKKVKAHQPLNMADYKTLMLLTNNPVAPPPGISGPKMNNIHLQLLSIKAKVDAEEIPDAVDGMNLAAALKSAGLDYGEEDTWNIMNAIINGADVAGVLNDILAGVAPGSGQSTATPPSVPMDLTIALNAVADAKTHGLTMAQLNLAQALDDNGITMSAAEQDQLAKALQTGKSTVADAVAELSGIMPAEQSLGTFPDPGYFGNITPSFNEKEAWLHTVDTLGFTRLGEILADEMYVYDEWDGTVLNGSPVLVEGMADNLGIKLSTKMNTDQLLTPAEASAVSLATKEASQTTTVGTQKVKFVSKKKKTVKV
jgi:hypothetical protein